MRIFPIPDSPEILRRILDEVTAFLDHYEAVRIESETVWRQLPLPGGLKERAALGDQEASNEISKRMEALRENPVFRSHLDRLARRASEPPRPLSLGGAYIDWPFLWENGPDDFNKQLASWIDAQKTPGFPGLKSSSVLMDLVVRLKIELVNKLDSALSLESRRAEEIQSAVKGRLSSSARREQSILDVLRRANQRLTLEQIISGVRALGEEHGDSTLRNHLAKLVGKGQLSNCKKCFPKGYGLPEWDCPHRKT